MRQDALFGQYWRHESPIHAMDARIKLTALVMTMVAIFAAQSFYGLLVSAVFLIVYYALAGIGVLQAIRAIAPLIFIVVLTALLNATFVQGGAVLIQAGPLTISQAGLLAAGFLSARLLLLLFAASLLTLTTPTLDLTDAFELVLDPFRKVGFPAHEFAMILGVALRFLPQFVQEWRTIRAAQLSRGAAPTGAIRSLSSLIIPLFTSAFRHADVLSSAMDARCYHGSIGRTKLHPLAYAHRDAVGLTVCTAHIVCVITCNIFS